MQANALISPLDEAMGLESSFLSLKVNAVVLLRRADVNEADYYHFTNLLLGHVGNTVNSSSNTILCSMK